MARLGNFIEWRTDSGSPVSVGDVTVTPQSQALIVHWPNGGFVWNRPVAVLVERGQEQECMRILDVTRILQVGLIVFSILLGIFTSKLRVRNRRNRNG
jgi:hypothetical protein